MLLLYCVKCFTALQAQARASTDTMQAPASSAQICVPLTLYAQVSVEEVVTPGGSCREVLVRQSFDHLVNHPEGLFRDPALGKRSSMVPSARSVPPELPDSKASKQPLADGSAPAGRKAASGQLTDADVAQAISDAGELAAHHKFKLSFWTTMCVFLPIKVSELLTRGPLQSCPTLLYRPILHL